LEGLRAGEHRHEDQGVGHEKKSHIRMIDPSPAGDSSPAVWRI
jgi:hypothetical protein